ncbi:MAG: NifB/NifX family molybdenum-iron cluster-binding protein [Desulfobacteraceae bacterium]|jgi:predicted Fe-Mo cluster-binding NifX family protein
MRVAISSQGETLEAEVDSRFGRASKFLLVDTETMAFKVIDNAQSLNLPQGAGIQAAQNVIPHKPDVVLTGNCGPKAFKTLEAASVDVVLGVKGKIRDAIQAYLDGKYQPARESNVEGHWM